jgi:hypothetical protein
MFQLVEELDVLKNEVNAMARQVDQLVVVRHGVVAPVETRSTGDRPCDVRWAYRHG